MNCDGDVATISSCKVEYMLTAEGACEPCIENCAICDAAEPLKCTANACMPGY